jgi:hypothetical protein
MELLELMNKGTRTQKEGPPFPSLLHGPESTQHIDPQLGMVGYISSFPNE